MGAPVGNLNSTKRQRAFGDALSRAIAQDDGARLRQAAEKLLDLAASGEQWAVKELADRLDGKSPQGMVLSGDAENPINTSIRVILGRD